MYLSGLALQRRLLFWWEFLYNSAFIEACGQNQGDLVKCPFCHYEESKVTDSRSAAETNAIRRRRECLHCFRRFTTFETVDLTIQVQKRDGTYEDFLLQKLINGLDAACRHTKISHDQVRLLADQVTRDLLEKQVREISTRDLGEIVMEHLQKMDIIAYIRFACVYRRFKEINELMEAIHSIATKEDEDGKSNLQNKELSHATQEN